MEPIQSIDDIIRDSFGLWITSLFSAISGRNPSLTFEEHKEAFFWLLGRLLREGTIKFIAPGADCYVSPENPHPRFTIHDEEAHWRESPDSIVAQLRSQWPGHVNDENDLELLTFFYSIPAIIWVGDNGELVAS